jgi:hypothetical protein
MRIPHEGFCKIVVGCCGSVFHAFDYDPVRPTKSVVCGMIVYTQGFCSHCMFASKPNNALARNTNVEEFLKELIEGVICIANNKDSLARRVMQDFREKCTNERLASA